VKKKPNIEKSILELDPDADYPGQPPTAMIERYKIAIRKKIKDLSIEDLRFLIGQHTTLSILIPLALKELENSLRCEGDYYEGDLLQSVLSTPKEYWVQHRDHYLKLYLTESGLRKTS
jgi:hypothetical protein